MNSGLQNILILSNHGHRSSIGSLLFVIPEGLVANINQVDNGTDTTQSTCKEVENPHSDFAQHKALYTGNTEEADQRTNQHALRRWCKR